MQIKSVLKIIGLLLMLFSISMLTPIFVSFYYDDGAAITFFEAFLVTFVTGGLLFVLFYKHYVELKVRDGFLIVTLFWVILSCFAALPFWIIEHKTMGFTNALFESVSGFTTTGSSVVDKLSLLPPSLLYYRQQLQLIGGMGIIVLAVAIIPMLGVGGMQLYRAETPGPMKDDKLTPRITETAKTIWFIYMGLVGLCTLAFWVSGMHLFDALEESFATVSTGGFSIHGASFAYYHSSLIECVAIVFMFLGGVNFSLHYMAVVRGDVTQYFKDQEFRAYLAIVVLVGLVISTVLLIYGVMPSTWRDFVSSFFTLTSIMTTTGFVSANYTQWPLFVPFVIILLGLLGACGGSTSGGMKVIRLVLLTKQFSREMKRLTHPQGVYLLKLGNKIVSPNVMNGIWAFVPAYLGVLTLATIFLMATGVNLDSSFGAVAACLGNIGAGLGTYAFSFDGLSEFAKWVLIFCMLAGRLEVFTVLLLFSTTFWRR